MIARICSRFRAIDDVLDYAYSTALRDAAYELLQAVDMQGFVCFLRGVELKYEPWDEMASTLALVHVMNSDVVEADSLTGETDVYKAAKFYAEMGPRDIVLTHKDSLLNYADGKFHEMNFYPARRDGRSGRGDSVLAPMSPREAGTWAAAVTSLKMENLGPFDRSIREIEDLIHSKYNGAVHK